MLDDAKNHCIEAFCVVVNHGIASKVMKYARKLGIPGGTIFLGLGTNRHNRLLNLLDLTDTRKEVLLMLMRDDEIDSVFEPIAQKFKFYQPNHGIAFTMPVHHIIGSQMYVECQMKEEVKESMYQAIFTIVEKGKAEDVITAATHVGSLGGTIINARGSGIHETTKLFNMDISPEKEIVLILAKVNEVERITNTIVDELGINEPGKGIIFVQDVSRTVGLY